MASSGIRAEPSVGMMASSDDDASSESKSLLLKKSAKISSESEDWLANRLDDLSSFVSSCLTSFSDLSASDVMSISVFAVSSDLTFVSVLISSLGESLLSALTSSSDFCFSASSRSWMAFCV